MRNHERFVLLVAAVVACAAAFYGCGSDAASTPTAPTGSTADSGDSSSDGSTALTPEQTFPTSLHATGRGKLTWYDPANGGFESMTHIRYLDLSCKSCHQPDCENCHDGSSRTVTQEKCLSCHGRQGAEAMHYSDVHRDAGMTCMDCHTLREMHGDGTEYASLLEPGAMDVRCQNEGCHPSVPDNSYHNLHGDAIDCSACHMQSVVTCYNCHFETEVNEQQKKAYGQFKDWMFLINHDGKVHPANFQSVKYGDDTFVAVGPYYGHTIKRDARTCSGCHDSAALQEYQETGKIQATTWNASTEQVDQITGVVPIPPDYQQSLKLDFVDLVGGQWQFMESGPDKIQLLYGTPLTQDQIDKLAQ